MEMTVGFRGRPNMTFITSGRPVTDSGGRQPVLGVHAWNSHFPLCSRDGEGGARGQPGRPRRRGGGGESPPGVDAGRYAQWRGHVGKGTPSARDRSKIVSVCLTCLCTATYHQVTRKAT